MRICCNPKSGTRIKAALAALLTPMGAGFAEFGCIIVKMTRSTFMRKTVTKLNKFSFIRSNQLSKPKKQHLILNTLVFIVYYYYICKGVFIRCRMYVCMYRWHIIFGVLIFS